MEPLCVMQTKYTNTIVVIEMEMLFHCYGTEVKLGNTVCKDIPTHIFLWQLDGSQQGGILCIFH